jgi:Helix-turn-helix domain
MKGEAMERLTDNRRTYTFYVDDAVLDVFGPQIGAYGIAVYALLARHAKHKQAFPSYKLIQQKLKIGRMTVVRTLAALEKAGLITITTRKSRVGDYDTKLYTLCDLSSFRGGGTCEVPPDTPQIPPGTCERPGVVPVRYQGGTCEVPEGISLKESHLKDPDPPIVPPGGGVAVSGKTVARPRTKKKTGYPTAPEAQATLRALVFDAAFDAWVRDKGLTIDLSVEWERFTGYGLAHGKEYADWRHAFMNWLTSPYQSKPASAVGNSNTMSKEAFIAEAEKWKGRI